MNSHSELECKIWSSLSNDINKRSLFPLWVINKCTSRFTYFSWILSSQTFLLFKRRCFTNRWISSFILPETASFACWQTRARSPQLHPTVCCELNSAGSQYTGPEGERWREWWLYNIWSDESCRFNSVGLGISLLPEYTQSVSWISAWQQIKLWRSWLFQSHQWHLCQSSTSRSHW